ncbi:hypothetical protein HYG77_35170 (plasmid) [Rhodococcus sp. ZPP]|uniref:hypothetical protein n=1 Tax=Rhodococcus sp. ZPP TaxID=2749906 RepID=UPI001AD89439|nr:MULTISPECIES: hypothetical protein [Rhodococcus]QTJ70705.1 hypothetical protein HYG77_35170 [Rhodococcus sp. ZPP]GLK41080.1 hypothetical protein GCM10017611_79550 [Rhodococcus wratislaviensis]
MATYQSTEEIYEVFVPFYERLTADPEVGPKFVKANTSFRIRHHDPEAVFLLDATQDPAVLSYGTEAETREPEVELLMSGDDGHKFWLGKLNLPVSLARKKIKVQGGVTKLMGLVPALQPAYTQYRAHLESLGRPTDS